jgi:hypothetical protein
MFPYNFRKETTPQERQQVKGAAYAKELKDYLTSLTPEDRARFWAEIEAPGNSQDERTPSGK